MHRVTKKNLHKWVTKLNLFLFTLTVLCSFDSAFANKAMKEGEILEYQASYQLRWYSLDVGTSVHSVQKIAPNHYRAEALSYPRISFLPFKAYDKSDFLVKGDQIIPLAYENETLEKINRTPTPQPLPALPGKLIFDWEQKKINYLQSNILTKTEDLKEKMQDQLSQHFQLHFDLKNKKAPYTYEVAGIKKTKTYTFQILREETIKTPIGDFATIKVEHISNNQERKTNFWLAKDYDYLIIKLEQFRKDKLIAESLIQSLLIHTPHDPIVQIPQQSGSGTNDTQVLKK